MKKTLLFLIISLTTITIFGQKQVESKLFDTGKMWTFDYPPVEYLNERYGFEPTNEWLQDVRLSALRFGNGCSASFVSGDGLIMTNHHCAESVKRKVAKDGEDLIRNGFYAETLELERKIPGLFVDQLIFMEDVTKEIQQAMDEGETDAEKIENKEDKIEELIEEYEEETELRCEFVSFFNGGKYSIYGYKRYDDIRLVFIPEEQIGYFGGDFDNFTYPRYNLDCAFVRAYDNGEPVDSKNFFQFNTKGIDKDEVIFTVGNPGRTSRLKTVAQLKYNRDVSYKNRAYYLNTYYNRLEELKSDYPERTDEFEKLKTRLGNAQKVIDNIYKGLTDPYLIARKQDFEDKLKNVVKEDTELNEKYGHIWDAIVKTRNELKEYDKKIAAYRISNFFDAWYFKTAKKIVNYIESEEYDEDSSKVFTEKLFKSQPDPVLDKLRLEVKAGILRMNLGKENELVRMLFDEKEGWKAAEYAVNKSILDNKEKIEKLVSGGSDQLQECKDPFVVFIKKTKDELKKLEKMSSEVNDTEDVFEDLLGRLLFEIHGTNIPPDANFTLRLSDGVLQSFDYNGTKAPVYTTFYGLYDRYYATDGEYPWGLHERWINPSNEFDMSTSYNFISTNDIVGGNSGSAIINKNAEVVGLAFDGNINSIVGNFIYMPKDNRCVAVSALGMLESIKDIYDAKRLYLELVNGKIN